jgi:hypothetical protein
VSGPGEQAPRRPGSRLLGLAVVGLVLAAVALWGASRGTWLTATWDVPLRGRVVTTVLGADAEPVLVPWALLALAAIGGLFATSGWGRRAVGVVVGVTAAWPLLAALGGVLLVAVGVLVAVRGSAMPRLGARYDAPGGRPRPRAADDERSLWEALDAGEDPTAPTGPDQRSGPDDPGPYGRSPGRAPDRAEGGRG